MSEFDGRNIHTQSYITSEEYREMLKQAVDQFALYVAATACCTALGFLLGYLLGAGQ